MIFKWDKPLGQIEREHGINKNGFVQKYIDSECIRLMKPYTPMLSGVLIKSATLGSTIGSGEIVQIAPYARYQYYGKLMVSSITGSAWAKMGESKVLTDKNITYSKINPNAGPFWFERMKSDHKKAILNGARKLSEAR